MEIDSKNITPGTTLTYDVCIIGAGAAGMCLANELEQEGKSIALMESGGESFHQATQDLYQGKVVEDNIDHPELDACRDRYLGGSTNTWGGWCLPLDEHDFLYGAPDNDNKWPISYGQDYAPFLQRACSYIDIGNNNFRSGDILETPHLNDALESSNKVQSEYLKYSPPTRFKNKYRTVFQNSNNVDLYLWANATNLTYNNGASKIDKADFKTLSGVNFSVSATTFILCLGGIETVRLLLNSNNEIATGIGNSQDQLGRYYSSHPIFKNGILVTKKNTRFLFESEENNENIFVQRGLKLKSEQKLNNELRNIYFWASSANSGDLKNFSPNLIQLEDSNNSFYSINCSLDMTQVSTNRITLSNDIDALGMKKVSLNFTVPPSDLENVLTSYRILGAELSKLNIGRLCIGDSVEKLIQKLDVVRYHHLGSTRMALSSSSGVVDTNLKIFGTTNAYISGCSVFSSSGYANPMLSILALTLRLSDYLKGVI